MKLIVSRSVVTARHCRLVLWFWVVGSQSAVRSMFETASSNMFMTMSAIVKGGIMSLMCLLVQACLTLIDVLMKSKS